MKKTPTVVSAPSTVSNSKFPVNLAQDFRTNLEALSFYPQGPFSGLSPDVVKLIWSKIIESEAAKAISGWKNEIEPQLPNWNMAYYRAAFAVVRTLYHQNGKDSTIIVDDKMEGKVFRFISLFARRDKTLEELLDQKIPGLRIPAGKILEQLDAAMTAQIIQKAIELGIGISAEDLGDQFEQHKARLEPGIIFDQWLAEQIANAKLSALKHLFTNTPARKWPAPAPTLRADHAAFAAPGGIDLNTSNGMQWKISKDGKGVEMSVDPAMIERIRREGISSLSPIIFKITPISSIWPLAGLRG